MLDLTEIKSYFSILNKSTGILDAFFTEGFFHGINGFLRRNDSDILDAIKEPFVEGVILAESGLTVIWVFLSLRFQQRIYSFKPCAGGCQPDLYGCKFFAHRILAKIKSYISMIWPKIGKSQDFLLIFKKQLALTSKKQYNKRRYRKKCKQGEAS